MQLFNRQQNNNPRQGFMNSLSGQTPGQLRRSRQMDKWSAVGQAHIPIISMAARAATNIAGGRGQSQNVPGRYNIGAGGYYPKPTTITSPHSGITMTGIYRTGSRRPDMNFAPDQGRRGTNFQSTTYIPQSSATSPQQNYQQSISQPSTNISSGTTTDNNYGWGNMGTSTTTTQMDQEGIQNAQPKIDDSQMSAAYKAYMDALNEQAKYQESYNAGRDNISDRVIPMEDQTGQFASLERKYQRGAEGYQNKVNEAQRAYQLEAQNYQNQMEMNKPVSVGSGSSLVNPYTGQVVYQGQSGDNMSELLSVSEANSLGVPYGTTRGEAISSLGMNTSTTGTDKGAILASKLVDSKGLRLATGTGLGRGFLRTDPARVDFVNKTEQLLSYLTLNTFAEAKAKGTTFGAMSNAEWDILRAAASEIGNARKMNKDGKTTGYNMSEQSMRDFLESLSRGGTGYSEVPSQGMPGNDPGGFFSNVGSDTNLAVNIPQQSRLAYVNNNPGNLRFAGQPGAVQGQGGFARFQSPQHGYQSLVRQVSLDAGRGKTLAQFIAKYAPPTENNTQRYIQNVWRMTGIDPRTPMNRVDPHIIARAIAMQESSTRIA
jgi:hypothetical protein